MSEYFETSAYGDVTVVQLVVTKLLDPLVIIQLGDGLVKFVRDTSPKKLVVSFDRVMRSSTEVVGTMIKLNKRVSAYGGVLRLCGMTDDIRTIFRECGVEGRLFEIFDTTAQAMEKF